MKITIDKSTFIPSTRTTTNEGYLRVTGNVARTGVQDYLAKELSLKDRNQDEVLKVYRPESEVFNPESLATFEGADVTLNHPNDGMVNVDSYKIHSVGTVKNAKRDGDFVVCDLIIKDQQAIDAINNGTSQLSAGYTAIYEPAPKDSPYDFIQTNIKVNHVALVNQARAGAQARINDAQFVMPRYKRDLLKRTGKLKPLSIATDIPQTMANDNARPVMSRAQENLLRRSGKL